MQLYYELKAEREKQGKEKEIAIIRVEQLAPFPFDLVCRELRRYPNADIMWCVTAEDSRHKDCLRDLARGSSKRPGSLLINCGGDHACALGIALLAVVLCAVKQKLTLPVLVPGARGFQRLLLQPGGKLSVYMLPREDMSKGSSQFAVHQTAFLLCLW